MARFALVTKWHIAAPQTAVWDAIYASERWPEWWPYVVSCCTLPSPPRRLNGRGSK